MVIDLLQNPCLDECGLLMSGGDCNFALSIHLSLSLYNIGKITIYPFIAFFFKKKKSL
jgi:hypothetical protein